MLQLTEDDLNEMKVPIATKNKILKRISERQREVDEAEARQMKKDKEFYGDLDSFLQSIGLENFKRLFTQNEI